MSIPAKRACDACHRRKVRCNSKYPCGNCSQAGLSCTYDAIPQKKGPKGSRAKVISELRERQSDPINPRPEYRSPPRSPTYAPTPGLLCPDLTTACLEFFFAHMYPTMPILQREQIGLLVGSMAHSVESYCLVAALDAFMLIQPGIAQHVPFSMDEPSGAITNPRMGTTLMDEVVRVRKGYDYVEHPTVHTIITSFFLFGCCFGLNKHNTAWVHLREATALAQILGMQDESTYAFGDQKENATNRRLFWLLFVTERAYALQKHRPLTLHATIGPPTVEPDPSSSINGFVHLVNLYRPFDDTFIGLWNKSRNDCSTYWLAQLQEQLTQALPPYLDTTESQAADLRTSQQWLRTMVWQLSISNSFLSSTSPDSSMTFQFPIEIAKDLVGVTSHFSKQAMEVHGIGLIEKVFDVACTLVDVMACVPHPSMPGPGPQEHLIQLLRLISTLRGGESRFLPLIMGKIRDTLPWICHRLPPDMMTRAAPHTLVNGSAFGPLGGINGLTGMNGLNGVSSVVMDGMNAMVGHEAYIKPEPTSGSSGTVSANVSESGTPYSTPPFMHYYPLA